MNSKRKFLGITCNTVWVAPLVNSVTLPVHASMSAMSWGFDMRFNENCLSCLADSDDNSDIIAIEPPIEIQQIYDITEEDIQSSEFIHFSGDQSDFSRYKFFIIESSSSAISGLVEHKNDLPELLRGTFETKKI